MPKYGQIVLGPAGSGKSTYSAAVQENFQVKGRTCHVVNLDPAAENDLKYGISGDIRELIVAREVSEQLDLGPNGGLVAAMEYLVDPEGGLSWLEDLLDSFNEDDYIVFDLPGQIELYTSHIPIVRKLGEFLMKRDIRVAVIHCMDALFVSDIHKFIAASLAAVAAMVTVDLPSVHVLTKFDLVQGTEAGEAFEGTDGFEGFDLGNCRGKLAAAGAAAGARAGAETYRRLNEAFLSLLEEFSLGKFVTFTAIDEGDSAEQVVTFVNNVINYGDELEPRDQDYLAGEFAEAGEGLRDQPESADNDFRY